MLLDFAIWKNELCTSRRSLYFKLHIYFLYYQLLLKMAILGVSFTQIVGYTGHFRVFTVDN
jgi:hypothetical protein